MRSVYRVKQNPAPAFMAVRSGVRACSRELACVARFACRYFSPGRQVAASVATCSLPRAGFAPFATGIALVVNGLRVSYRGYGNASGAYHQASSNHLDRRNQLIMIANAKSRHALLASTSPNEAAVDHQKHDENVNHADGADALAPVNDGRHFLPEQSIFLRRLRRITFFFRGRARMLPASPAAWFTRSGSTASKLTSTSRL